VCDDEEQREELFDAKRDIDAELIASRPKTAKSRNGFVERPLPPPTEEKVPLFIKPSTSWKRCVTVA
jgi:hypothetical protein